MSKEKLIEKIMKECEQDGEPVTREEAEEMAEMEIKASGIKHYETADKPRKASTKVRKVDESKKAILAECEKALTAMEATEIEVKTETEISFLLDGASYSLKLIKHREKK